MKPIGDAMAMQFLACFGRHLRAFRMDRRGNVAVIFGLTLIPLFGAVGFAIDYSRANSTRTAMQSALDTTALMLSKEADDLDKGELRKKAERYFLANFRRPEGQNIKITSDLKEIGTSQYSLTLRGQGKVDTTIARVLSDKVMDIDVTSSVAWGMKKLEVVLALDNTGSMARLGKMDELKKAAQTLLDVLKKAEKKKDDIKVAIIPFDYTVNVGTAAKDASWLNWLLPKNSWEGCVGDRDSPFDATDTPPSPLDLLSLFPATRCAPDQRDWTRTKPVATMLPLTSDWSDLKNKIKEMEPNGNTNVSIGLVWGWHALTSNAPLNQADPPKFNLEKAIILLTDGLNTQNRFGETTAQIDARTRKTCENIRAAKIQLYTIRVIDGNVDLLKGCATSPDMFFNVQDASQLNSVFESIAAKLAKLHIAK
jgi:Flp pilus assembly protein TadG